MVVRRFLDSLSVAPLVLPDMVFQEREVEGEEEEDRGGEEGGGGRRRGERRKENKRKKEGREGWTPRGRGGEGERGPGKESGTSRA